MSDLSPSDRLRLQEMISANNCEDNTNKIREIKHSNQIREEVTKLVNLKSEYKRLAQTNKSQFDQICTSRCAWLFEHYHDIYIRVLKDELDMTILAKLLSTLKQIEDGKLDQHEASYEVGKVLKEMYVDSALKKAEKLDAVHSKTGAKKGPKTRNISYAQFCAMQGK